MVRYATVIKSREEVIEEPGGYTNEITHLFTSIPDMAIPLLEAAEDNFVKIEELLYSLDSFVNMIKGSIPIETLQAVLTKDQEKKLAKGVLKLMSKKDGSLMANLINPKTKKIVATVPLKEVKMTPEMSQAVTNYAMQMQMAQIAEQIREVQLAIEEVHMGQESDRLATAYSCQQKLLQAMEIKNPELKKMALMSLATAAEDSRNLLMLSQKSNVDFIVDQPENFFLKMFNGANEDKINSRISEIRESLNAVNLVSLTEALAYQELGEVDAARTSLDYFAKYIDNTYLDKPGLIQRLDMVDPSPDNYWSAALPAISRNIHALPYAENVKSIETSSIKEETVK